VDGQGQVYHLVEALGFGVIGSKDHLSPYRCIVSLIAYTELGKKASAPRDVKPVCPSGDLCFRIPLGGAEI
jgi:hypothetical protein